MAQKGEQTHTSRLIRGRRPLHRWLETASMPSTGSGQRRTIPIYFEPHSPALRRDLPAGAGAVPRCRGPCEGPRSTSLCFRAEGPDRGRGIQRPGRLSVVDTWEGATPRSEGPDRRAPFPPTPPGTERPGGSRGEPLMWQPPTHGETFILKAQGGCHQGPQAYKSAPERLEIPGGLHPEPVVGQQSGHVRHGLGTTVLGKKGILGAQTLVLHLPSGGLALSLCGRLVLDPQMQPGGLGRHGHPGYSAGAGSPAFLEEDGALPNQYLVGICGGPNHALCTAGSSQARHNPGHS